MKQLTQLSTKNIVFNNVNYDVKKFILFID